MLYLNLCYLARGDGVTHRSVEIRFFVALIFEIFGDTRKQPHENRTCDREEKSA